MPFSLSSSRPRVLCTLSLGKGGGELGEHREEPGGGNREGKEERLPNSHWPMAPPPPFLLSPPLPPPPKNASQITLRLSFFTLQRIVGPSYLSQELSSPACSGNQKLFSCFSCQQRHFLLARLPETPCIQESSATDNNLCLRPYPLSPTFVILKEHLLEGRVSGFRC